MNGTPTDLSFDIFVRSGENEVKAGSFACPAGTSAHSYGLQVQGMPAGPKNVDVILRSKINAALNTLDTFAAWKGEIVFKDVPVK